MQHSSRTRPAPTGRVLGDSQQSFIARDFLETPKFKQDEHLDQLIEHVGKEASVSSPSQPAPHEFSVTTLTTEH